MVPEVAAADLDGDPANDNQIGQDLDSESELAERMETPTVPEGIQEIDSGTAGRAPTVHDTVELPDDSRIAVLVWREQSVEHADFAAMEALADGEVMRLTQGAVIRLRTETPLRFGDVAIPTGNLAPGFAGSYGLWLKRSGDEWRLVFNHEADSWGTQHDPAFDAAEIDVTYSRTGLGTRPLGAALVPATARNLQLVIHWGAHEWAADFTVAE